MTKKHLSLAEIDEQSAIELPDRNLFAVAVGGAGAAAAGAIAAAVAVNAQIPIDVNVEDNQICVNVAAVGAAAGCAQD